MSTPFVGDVGTLVRLDVGSDVTGASVARIKYVKPDGTTGYWTATVSTRYLSYVTVLGDLDQKGSYIVQAYVETPSGKWNGRKARFSVEEAL